MEEPEVPTEHLHESIEEKVEELEHEAKHELSKKGWTLWLAVSTAFMAVFAAMASLQAGHRSNEAMISQIQSSDKWAYYESKGIKSEITQNMLLGKPADSSALKKKIAKYKAQQDTISEQATDLEKESSANLEKYKTLAMAVSLFQVSIAISAIAMLTRVKYLWYTALLISCGGIFQFIMGYFA
jgi:Domain of unknown function (DUF4337)